MWLWYSSVAPSGLLSFLLGKELCLAVEIGYCHMSLLLHATNCILVVRADVLYHDIIAWFGEPCRVVSCIAEPFCGF